MILISSIYLRTINQSGQRISRQVDGRIIRNFFDRTLTGNTTGFSATFDVEGCSTLKLVQSSTAAGVTPATFALEGSEDGVNFYDLGTVSTTAGTATTTMVRVADINCKFVRVECTIAGTGNVMNYLNIRGQE